jgi:hypothetical protein
MTVAPLAFPRQAAGMGPARIGQEPCLAIMSSNSQAYDSGRKRTAVPLLDTSSVTA